MISAPPRPALAAFALFGVTAIVMAGPALAADPEPYRLAVSGACQVERLNSPDADSLGIALTYASALRLGFDFRVVQVPLKGPERPALHVFGHALVTQRPVAVLTGSPSTSTPAQLDNVFVTELNGGVALSVPMSVLDPTAGARMYIGYQGTFVVAAGTSQDFLRLKQGLLGFERTRGLFEGSLAELAYGRNESWGLQNASPRWAARFRVQTLLGPGAAPPATTRATPGKPAASRASYGSPLRAFAELSVDTDGSTGTDMIQGQLGLMLDASNVLQRVLGSPN